MAKRKRRTFTPEFKIEVVLEALRGETSQAELCRRHNLSEDQVSKWKQQFLENAVSVFAPSNLQKSPIQTIGKIFTQPYPVFSSHSGSDVVD